MPRDYKRPMSPAKASRPFPAWALLGAGVLLGLFLAFLGYLSGLPSAVPLSELALPAPAPPKAAARGQGGGAAPAPAAQRPRFEFYSILPELEVVVPDPPPQEPARDAPEAPEPPAAAVDAGAAYFLQAGSFKITAEAERMKASLALLGLDVLVQTVSVNGVRWHRVRVGPFRDGQALADARRRLREQQIDFITLKSSGL